MSVSIWSQTQIVVCGFLFWPGIQWRMSVYCWLQYTVKKTVPSLALFFSTLSALSLAIFSSSSSSALLTSLPLPSSPAHAILTDQRHLYSKTYQQPAINHEWTIYCAQCTLHRAPFISSLATAFLLQQCMPLCNKLHQGMRWLCCSLARFCASFLKSHDLIWVHLC